MQDVKTSKFHFVFGEMCFYVLSMVAVNIKATSTFYDSVIQCWIYYYYYYYYCIIIALLF